MAIEIRGAPAPGWYLPVGLGASDRSPYLWTGIAQLHGEYPMGYVIELIIRGKELRIKPAWRAAEMVRGLSRVPIAYERVEAFPDVWRDQDFCEAAKQCEAEVEKYRALIERLEQENQAR